MFDQIITFLIVIISICFGYFLKEFSNRIEMKVKKAVEKRNQAKIARSFEVIRPREYEIEQNKIKAQKEEEAKQWF